MASDDDPSQWKRSAAEQDRTGEEFPPERRTPSKGKRKRSGWREPSNRPKRPLSAYNLYFQEERQRLLEEQEAQVCAAAAAGGRTKEPAKPSELTQLVAANWRNTSEEEKAPYEARAVEDRRRYQDELQQWQQEKEKDQNQALVAAERVAHYMPRTDPVHPDLALGFNAGPVLPPNLAASLYGASGSNLSGMDPSWAFPLGTSGPYSFLTRSDPEAPMVTNRPHPSTASSQMDSRLMPLLLPTAASAHTMGPEAQGGSQNPQHDLLALMSVPHQGFGLIRRPSAIGQATGRYESPEQKRESALGQPRAESDNPPQEAPPIEDSSRGSSEPQWSLIDALLQEQDLTRSSSTGHGNLFMPARASQYEQIPATFPTLPNQAPPPYSQGGPQQAGLGFSPYHQLSTFEPFPTVQFQVNPMPPRNLSAPLPAFSLASASPLSSGAALAPLSANLDQDSINFIVHTFRHAPPPPPASQTGSPSSQAPEQEQQPR